MRRNLDWAAMAVVVLVSTGCDETVEDGKGEASVEGRKCELRADIRECGEDDGSVQYCDHFDGDLKWGPCLAQTECEPGETQSCFGANSDVGDISQTCTLYAGIPAWEEEACNTPLVLAFEPGAVQMTSAGPASFDISGASACVTTDWPAASTPWLAIDLDHSGTIDGGHELFGSGTVLGSGQHAANGFAALHELDSDGDGSISALDERFSELVLWSDYDGDRRSTLWELEPLSQRGVESIALSYQSGRECDDRGNCARERSRFVFSAGSQRQAGEVIDMHLACQ